MNQLQQQLQSLSQQMEQLRNSGEIAPDSTWIQKFYIPKNGKRYEYYRLMKAGDRSLQNWQSPRPGGKVSRQASKPTLSTFQSCERAPKSTQETTAYVPKIIQV